MARLALCECGCGSPVSIAKITSTAKGWRKGEPLRFVRGHATKQLRRPLESWWIVDANGCWVWQGAKNWGYGYYKPAGRKQVRAHRYLYELHKGPIPDGLVLDHLCCNKGCVNPDHLEAVTGLENTRRFNASRLTCKRGHPLEGDNVYLYDGTRNCRQCRKGWRRSHP